MAVLPHSSGRYYASNNSVRRRTRSRGQSCLLGGLLFLGGVLLLALTVSNQPRENLRIDLKKAQEYMHFAQLPSALALHPEQPTEKREELFHIKDKYHDMVPENGKHLYDGSVTMKPAQQQDLSGGGDVVKQHGSDRHLDQKPDSARGMEAEHAPAIQGVLDQSRYETELSGHLAARGGHLPNVGGLVAEADAVADAEVP